MKCSICGDEMKEKYGNNAEPINNGQCCDKCNIEVVVPARLKLFEENRTNIINSLTPQQLKFYKDLK